MRRSILGLCVLATFAVSQPALAEDGDAFSNAKANFYVFAGRNEPTATAYAIINWAKGANKWVVTGEMLDARPDTYTLSVGTAGTCTDNFEIITFSTDGSGYATFGAEVSYTDFPNFPTGYNIVRIYREGNACTTELTAPAGDGSLRFRGLNRMQADFDPASAE